MEDRHLLPGRINDPILVDAVALVDALLVNAVLTGRRGREDLYDEVRDDPQELSRDGFWTSSKPSDGNEGNANAAALCLNRTKWR